MILDRSDPTGHGLFSKCARNQAARGQSKKSPSTSASRLKLPDELFRRKPLPPVGFGKQESREQRERKYLRDETPPVGQYHPTYRQAPKLVWDILRAYHSSKKYETTPLPLPKPDQSLTADPLQTATLEVSPPPNEEECEVGEQMASLPTQGNENSHSSALQRSQCLVNMDRSTGRREERVFVTDWGDSDVMRAVKFVKGSIVKNIYLARQPVERTRKKTINPATNYDFDYKVVRPKDGRLPQFAGGRGRERVKTEHVHSYQHYEYDAYVWGERSRVYPNTKTHLIGFSSQPGRYDRPPRPRP